MVSLRAIFCSILGMVALALSPVMASAGCVSSFQTKLREKPSEAARTSWVVGRHMPLLEESRQGEWTKVRDLDGEVHWVLSRELTSRHRCVVVRVNQASLRTAPGNQAPLASLRTVDKYTAFKRIETGEEPEGWYWVEDEVSDRYWIRADQVWRPLSVSKIGF